MNMILSSLVTITLILFNFKNKLSSKLVKELSLIFSLILFATIILIWIIFNPYEQILQLNFTLYTFQFSFHFGLDGISLLFIFLTTFLIPICILFNWSNSLRITNDLYFTLITLEIVLILIFITQNVLFFYICFEITLIPLFILIGINNYRTRRIHAAYLLFLYTLFGSLFMLTTLLYLYSSVGSLNYYLLYNSEVDFESQKILWVLLFCSLAVKIPLFPFHIWLPEAHVEAPTEGSILLAGILLKLGIYGYIKILIPIFYQATIYYLPITYTVAAISGIYASLATLRQTDIKKTIAYSSVAHMSIGILGLFTLKPIGMIGSIILMFSHGIVSGALFLLIGMLYDRFKTKTIMYFNGLVHLMPLLTTAFFLFILGNISFPGTSSFIGEGLILLDIVSTHIGSMLLIGIILFLCTVYSLLLFNKIFFGILSNFKINYVFDLTRREINMIIPFIILMIWLGIYPHSFITLLESNLYYYSFNT